MDRIGSCRGTSGNVCRAVKNQIQPILTWMTQGMRQGCPQQCHKAAQTAGWLWPSGHTEGDWLRAPPPLMNLVKQKKGKLGMYQEKFRSRLLEAAISLASTGHCCNENCTSNCQN